MGFRGETVPRLSNRQNFFTKMDKLAVENSLPPGETEFYFNGQIRFYNFCLQNSSKFVNNSSKLLQNRQILLLSKFNFVPGITDASSTSPTPSLRDAGPIVLTTRKTTALEIFKLLFSGQKWVTLEWVTLGFWAEFGPKLLKNNEKSSVW